METHFFSDAKQLGGESLHKTVFVVKPFEASQPHLSFKSERTVLPSFSLLCYRTFAQWRRTQHMHTTSGPTRSVARQRRPLGAKRTPRALPSGRARPVAPQLQLRPTEHHGRDAEIAVARDFQKLR